MHKSRANLAVGLNCLVSIELMVFLETPTSFASADCDKRCSNRACLRLFFNSSLSVIF